MLLDVFLCCLELWIVSYSYLTFASNSEIIRWLRNERTSNSANSNELSHLKSYIYALKNIRKLYYIFVLTFNKSCFSKFSSVKEYLSSLNTPFPCENKRSAGADEGIKVLNFLNTLSIVGYSFKLL